MTCERENAKVPTPKYRNDDEKVNTINALRIEIEELRKKLADNEEIMDCLVRERDEELYELKLRLADAEKATLIDDENKSYCAAVKNATNDSGVDLNVMTRKIKNQAEICVEEKLGNLGIKTDKEIMQKNDDEENIS